MPLPPYIRRGPDAEQNTSDRQDYQTIFAKEEGAVAAPTAGLHFTEQLFQSLEKRGVAFETVTLHVGAGTFLPVKVDDTEDHKMHAEWAEIDRRAIDQLKIKNEKLKINPRVIAVGTTSARSLEACWNDFVPAKSITHPASPGALIKLKPTPSSQGLSTPPREGNSLLNGDFKSWVDIFIYPGYKFKIVDAMITNFHLPKSTLLMLVSALAGKKNIDRAYAEAIKKKYRFYSYGDAMFIK